jgi:hypothetical protein
MVYDHGDRVQYVMTAFRCEVEGGELTPDGFEVTEARYVAAYEWQHLGSRWAHDAFPVLYEPPIGGDRAVRPVVVVPPAVEMVGHASLVVEPRVGSGANDDGLRTGGRDDGVGVARGTRAVPGRLWPAEGSRAPNHDGSEHAVVEDYPILPRVATSLRRHGVLIVVDDAGAGFSSPPNIVRVRFAHETGCELIAEGIGQPSELHTWRDVGRPRRPGLPPRPDQDPYRSPPPTPPSPPDPVPRSPARLATTDGRRTRRNGTTYSRLG